MKKIILTLLIVVLAFSMMACGPDYTEEFNAAVEAYNEKVDEYDDSAKDFKDEVEDIESAEDLEALCNEMLELDEDMLEDTKAYLEEIKGYEKGIKDVEAYEKTIENMEDTIQTVEEDIESIPTLKDFYSISMGLLELATEWQTAVTEESTAMATCTEIEQVNTAIDNIIAINNDYNTKFSDISTKLGELDLPEYSDDIDDAISEIDTFILTITQLTEQMESLKQ